MKLFIVSLAFSVLGFLIGNTLGVIFFDAEFSSIASSGSLAWAVVALILAVVLAKIIKDSQNDPAEELAVAERLNPSSPNSLPWVLTALVLVVLWLCLIVLNQSKLIHTFSWIIFLALIYLAVFLFLAFVQLTAKGERAKALKESAFWVQSIPQPAAVATISFTAGTFYSLFASHLSTWFR